MHISSRKQRKISLFLLRSTTKKKKKKQKKTKKNEMNKFKRVRILTARSSFQVEWSKTILVAHLKGLNTIYLNVGDTVKCGLKC